MIWICKYCGENEYPQCPSCVSEDRQMVSDELCEVADNARKYKKESPDENK